MDADFEELSQASTLANGDDITKTAPDFVDDEDGLNNPAFDLTVTVGSQPTVNVIVTNLTGQAATLYGWIDTNGDGEFDNETERASSDELGVTIGEVVTLTFPTVQSGFTGQTYARFRLSTDVTAANPTGPATDGEVEDYVANVVMPSSGDVGSTRTLGSSYLLDNEFGQSVAYVGDIDNDGIDDLVAGAPGDETGGDNRGAVHVLLRNADGTLKSKKIIGSDTGGFGALSDGDNFGSSVAAVGDLDNNSVPDIAVGARYDNTGGSNRGAIYVLLLNEDGTVKSSTKIASDMGGLETLGEYAYFGQSLTSLGDINGDGFTDLAVGSNSEVSGQQGAVHVLLMNSEYLVESSQIIANNTGGFGSTNTGNSFGYSVAGLGDVDKDGTPDLAIGETKGGISGRGAVHVLLMNNDGTAKSYNSLEKSGSDHGGLGLSLAALGDVTLNEVPDLAILGSGINGRTVDLVQLNSDGTGSFLAGSPLISLAGSLASRGYLHAEFGTTELVVGIPRRHDEVVKSYTIGAYGSWEGWRSTIGTFGKAGRLFGTSVASMGDLDGNGANDLAVGDPLGEGAVHLLFTNSAGVVQSTTEISSNKNGLGSLVFGDEFGASVTFMEDLNGDGVSDLVVGAPGSANIQGATFVLFLNPDGTVNKSTEISSNFNGGPHLTAGDRFGSSVAFLGDLNGDGIGDLAVGAEHQNGYGVVYVLLMDSDGTVKNYREITHNQAGLGPLGLNAQFGSAIAAVGDLNADGITDLSVASQGSGFVDVLFLNNFLDNDGSIKGVARVFEQPDSVLSLAAMGDLDFDGLSELAIGTGDSTHFLYLNSDGIVREETVDSKLPGNSIASIGDWNHDDVIDFAVGVPFASGYGRLHIKHLQPLRIGDLGDAPDDAPGTGLGNYNTRWTDNGPVHQVGGGLSLGEYPTGGSRWITQSSAGTRNCRR